MTLVSCDRCNEFKRPHVFELAISSFVNEFSPRLSHVGPLRVANCPTSLIGRSSCRHFDCSCRLYRAIPRIKRRLAIRHGQPGCGDCTPVMIAGKQMIVTASTFLLSGRKLGDTSNCTEIQLVDIPPRSFPRLLDRLIAVVSTVSGERYNIPCQFHSAASHDFTCLTVLVLIIASMPAGG